MSVEPGQCWEVWLWASATAEERVSVLLLVLSVGPRSRVRCLTLDSSHEGTWPSGEVIAEWDLFDFAAEAERIA